MSERNPVNFEGFSIGEEVSIPTKDGGIVTGGTITGFDAERRVFKILPPSEPSPSTDAAATSEHARAMDLIEVTVDELLVANPRK